MSAVLDLPPARILVVDDQRVHRDKLVLAVRALGHEGESVDGGANALRRLAAEPFDLVLLDILMPDMDGFEVMSVMQRDRRLKDIPVIVVSALGSEMDAVVRAVEMGAEDMLPKRFDRVLLAARLDSALERRRARAREREHHHHVRRLTDAAAIMEHQPGLAPDDLHLGETCRRDDAIGRLARVFVHMSGEVRARDARLRHQLALLRLAGLALAAGVVLGFAPVLARTALLHQPHPFGLALWLAALVALLCLPAAIWRGRLPRAGGAALGRRVVALAASGVLMGTLPLLWLATTLPAGVLASVLPAELAVALALAALLDGRRPSASRLLAIALGVAATGALGSHVGGVLPWRPDTLAIALVAPLGWALAGRTLARARARGDDADVDALAFVGLVALAAVAALAPLAIALDDLIPLSDVLPVPANGAAAAVTGTGGIGVGLVVALLATVLAAGATLRVLLAREGGAEPAGAASLACALVALGSGTLVLGERAPPGIWLPLALFAAALLARTVSLRDVDPAPRPPLDVELA